MMKNGLERQQGGGVLNSEDRDYRSTPMVSGVIPVTEEDENTHSVISAVTTGDYSVNFEVYEQYGVGIFNSQGIARGTVKKEEHWTFEF